MVTARFFSLKTRCNHDSDYFSCLFYDKIVTENKLCDRMSSDVITIEICSVIFLQRNFATEDEICNGKVSNGIAMTFFSVISLRWNFMTEYKIYNGKVTACFLIK